MQRAFNFGGVARAFLAVAALALVAACGSDGPKLGAGSATLSTRVQGTWKDPRYSWPPMQRIFVVSLMKLEPGGRAPVEDAIVARLATAGVTGVAAHTVMSDDADKPGPTLEEAIVAARADGVLLVDVKSVGFYESYTVGASGTSLSPDTMASYKYLQRQGADQSGDYKVAKIVSELYLPSMGRQVWTAFTDTYDASNIARNLPDFTLKLVGVMARDRIIAAPPKPS